jgi:hypothetical protein
MIAILGILALIAAIAQFVCWIIVLTKLFPAEGALKGIFAVICSIYALIWGWQNVNRYDIKNIMTIWSVALAVSIVVQIITLSTTSAVKSYG